MTTEQDNVRLKPLTATGLSVDVTDIDLHTRRAAIQQLYQQSWSGLIGVLLVGMSACLILWPVLPHERLLRWYGGVVVLSVLRALLLFSFQRGRHRPDDPDYWGNWHVFGVVLSGLWWAVPTLYLWPEGQPVYQMIWSVLVLPLSAVAVAAYSTWTASYLGFLLLATLPIAVRYLNEGSITFTLLGLLALAFTIILAQTGKRLHVANRTRLAISLRNEALSTYLTAEKTKVDELNATLQLEVAERTRSQQQLAQRNHELEHALSNVKQLSGLLPICGSCKKIRNDKGYWEKLEAFIRQRSEAQFSHGICPDCAKQQFPDIF